MKAARTSLRARLMVLLLGATGIVWAVVALTTFADARFHAQRLFDAQLAAYSEVLGALVGHEIYEISDHPQILDAAYAQRCTYQILSPVGEVMLRSDAAPRWPLAIAEGFDDVTMEGKRWRTFRRQDPVNEYVVIVAHDVSERESLVQGIAWRLVLPLLLGIPLIAIALWFAVTRSLRPLDRLALQVRGRDAGQLSPLAAEDAPREVKPLVDALDQLFVRLGRSFENERRFTGDAAHELRTPLAALKTQAEVALATASETRREHALQQVVAASDRATRLVEQLLVLARLDVDAPREFAVFDFLALARETVDEILPPAAAKPVAVAVEPRGAGPWTVRGEAQMLHAMLRNLLENAVRHTPPQGRVAVVLAHDGGDMVLTVEDSGPGVPEALRERIFDRLFRSPGPDSGASGLGLSIARRVAELHHGTIAARASDRLGGLAIVVRIPAA